MERLELIVLLISVVISVIVGDYLYSVTHNVLVNMVTIFVGTPILYYGVKWIARASGHPLRDY
jgi:hypothetical protein